MIKGLSKSYIESDIVTFIESNQTKKKKKCCHANNPTLESKKSYLIAKKNSTHRFYVSMNIANTM